MIRLGNATKDDKVWRLRTCTNKKTDSIGTGGKTDFSYRGTTFSIKDTSENSVKERT